MSEARAENEAQEKKRKRSKKRAKQVQEYISDEDESEDIPPPPPKSETQRQRRRSSVAGGISSGRRSSIQGAELAGTFDDDMLLTATRWGFSMEDARAHAEQIAETKSMRTPEEVLSELQKGNARFWTGAAVRPEMSAFERRALIKSQFPTVAILGCSDSRVPVEIVFDQGLGDIFVVRVAGNILDTSTQASLQYAIRHLKVKVVLVMGHEGCGAIKASMNPVEGIEKEPKILADLLKSIKGGLDEDRLGWAQDTRARDRESVVNNVTKQVIALTKDPVVISAVNAEELIVAGAFYEISSGIVDFFYEVSNIMTKQVSEDGKVEQTSQPSKGVSSRFDPTTKSVTRERTLCDKLGVKK
jgi:carbonic anhydrase